MSRELAPGPISLFYSYSHRDERLPTSCPSISLFSSKLDTSGSGMTVRF
jgi:hypothetical protein